MSAPLDLKTVLFLNVQETAQLFRQTPAWVYRNRNGLLKPAARRFGPKCLLFLQSELVRLISEAADPPALARKRGQRKRFTVKTGKGYNGVVPGESAPGDHSTGGETNG